MLKKLRKLVFQYLYEHPEYQDSSTTEILFQLYQDGQIDTRNIHQLACEFDLAFPKWRHSPILVITKKHYLNPRRSRRKSHFRNEYCEKGDFCE